MNKNNELALSIMQLLGGKENISDVFHCMTRLRVLVKDMGLAKLDDVEKLEGVLGVHVTNGEIQIIIGPKVEELYKELVKVGCFSKNDAIEENLDEGMSTKEKFSFKKIGSKILGYISPIMIGILPVMIGASMAKTLGVVLGPSVLNVISDSSDLYIMLDILYKGFFYFLPIYLGYLSAKQLNTSILLGMYLGAMIIVPDFVAMVGVRDSISIFGISAPVAAYGQTFLPVIIGAVIMKYVYDFFKKFIPEVLAPIFVPTFTILVMTLVMFVVTAPIGSYLGDLIGNMFIYLVSANAIVRLFGYIALGILFPYIILGGMHMVLINFAIITYITNGFEAFVLPLSIGYSFAIYGIAFGAMMKLKNQKERSLALSYTTSGLLAGISEPILYGIVMKYKYGMRAMLIAGATGGIFCGFLLPKVYLAGSLVNVFSVLPMWVGGGSSNTIMGMMLVLVTFVVGTLSAYFIIDYKEIY